MKPKVRQIWRFLICVEGENGAHSINRDPKLARLPMGPLTGSINRMQFREGENGAHSINRDLKLARLHMGHLFGPNIASW